MESEIQQPQSDISTIEFTAFNLYPELMRGIEDEGFVQCTPIQTEVLKHTLEGADAIGRAQTGTGKTAAFLVTIIEDLLRNPITVKRYAGEPRALIIAPTRELALQIEKDARTLARHTSLQIMSVVGGMNFNLQQERLHRALIDILVATPGRLLDFAGRKDVWLDRVEILVLDEADRMLDMGFIPDVKRIIHHTPKSTYRQTLLFSATFSPDVMNLAKRWTESPVVVEIEPAQVTTETVDQIVYITETSRKFNLLYNLITRENLDKVMVFANRRDITRKLCEKMQRKGMSVAMISGDVPQQRRLKTLEAFRNGKVRVLIATDVAGRGIHIDGISHVVNYNLPEDPEDYVHRIGRTGRAGAKGTSISFACEEDAFLLPELENAIGMSLESVYPPEDLLCDPDSEPMNKTRDASRQETPAEAEQASDGSDDSRKETPAEAEQASDGSDDSRKETPAEAGQVSDDTDASKA